MLIFVVLISVVYVAKPIDDPDTWWHLKTGRLIAETGQIPQTDSFSYLIQGKHWIVHEWLAQLAFWKAWENGGPYGLFLLREGFAAVLFGLLFLWGASAPFAASALILFGLSFMGFGIVERPQLFTFLFSLGYRWLLPRFCEASGKTKRFWAAAVLTAHAFWSNLHGAASVVGVVIVGAYAAGEFAGRERRKSAWTALLTLGTVIACAANPSGFAIYERFFGEFMVPVKSWVTETAPLAFGSAGFWIYLSYLAVLSFGIWNLEPGWRRWTGLILGAGFGGAAGFMAVRNIPWVFFITAPDALCGLARFFRARPRLALGAPALFVFSIFIFHPWLIFSGSPKPKQPVPLTQEWMKGSADFIERRGLRGRMYNDYVIGGYLIWRLSPGRQVFVDGRGWEYGVELMGRLYTISLKGGFEDLDRVHQFDYVVFQQRKDNRLLYMDNHPDWRCVYFDDGGLIYAHRRRANAEIANRGYEILKPNEQTFEYLHAYLQDEKSARKALSEIDRAIRESPPDLSVNAYLMKSYFLQVWKGPYEWAGWMAAQRARFEHPVWRAQADAAMRMVK